LNIKSPRKRVFYVVSDDEILYNHPMIELLLILILILIAIAAVLLVLLFTRSGHPSAGTDTRLNLLSQGQERLERGLREELARNREEASAGSRQAREELSSSFDHFGEALQKRMIEIAQFQKAQLDTFAQQLKSLTGSTEQRLDKLRETVESQLRLIQEDSAKKLEQMRATVDEKLHDTLEKRLGDSFKQVSERLELVHKGLGEMQSLASGVGDLKKVLTNVKSRGTFGEVQLGSLLEQILAPEQYETNVATKKGSAARVEFAVKLPGRDEAQRHTVWLPLDAKFPQEDYLRLLEAQEAANPELAAEALKQLEKSVRESAKSIRDKYLSPPDTTDFGIMFLPAEGLYAEVLRRPGLFELLQREYKTILTGPTTLAALLNSLQMGFRTLAIEKRSSEVWTLLGAVKSEFATFGNILDKTSKKLQEASNTMESAAVRSRAIERKLRDVQALPSGEAAALLETALLPHEEEE
jgi:DNA recombination protein RmuC